LLDKRTLCFEHATDLIEAAERIFREGRSLPNIAFHLVLLAIEEMGKAGLIAAREVGTGHRDTAWIDKRLDDHAFKILWELWTPAFNAGNLSDGDSDTTPKDAVQPSEVESLLNLAKANLGFLSREGVT